MSSLGIKLNEYWYVIVNSCNYLLIYFILQFCVAFNHNIVAYSHRKDSPTIGFLLYKLIPQVLPSSTNF